MESGSFLLGRLDSYLLMVHVLEEGLGFRTVSIKGLELQEQTSCHAAEAAKVDEMFERVMSQERGVPNPEPWCVLSPLDMAQVTAYTSSTMTLTGVIDSAEFLDSLLELFERCLLWALLVQRIEVFIPVEDAVPEPLTLSAHVARFMVWERDRDLDLDTLALPHFVESGRLLDRDHPLD
ncbi:hypothetical protein HPB49_021044 [Dermacentor silvarum]|uniref:Uncharacterized protein n=1 Tax=Dermacentor silvarum TaxID=543639 RepID=A0ACB8CH83_DERSI|nr:hypothetical protein HPB49_021044 [Dermacentor silvarum]